MSTDKSSWNIFVILLLLVFTLFVNSCGKSWFFASWRNVDLYLSPEPTPSPALIAINQLGFSTMGEDADADDSAKAINFDTSGNIYIAGNTKSSLGEVFGGGTDAFVAKFDSTGAFEWASQLGDVTMSGGESSGNEYTRAIALDDLGNIYITGNTDGSFGETNGGNSDVFVAKFNSSGVKQWVSQLGSDTLTLGEPSAHDNASSITFDDTGNIYICGITSGNLGETNGGGSDVFIAKFNSSGVNQWVSQLGSDTLVGGEPSMSESASGIGLDSSGNIYVGGNTEGDLGEVNGGGGNGDVFVVKFNSSGVHQWIKQLGNVTLPGGESAASEHVEAMSFDNITGDIYIGGRTSGSFGETHESSFDAFVVKFNSDGVYQWISQLGADTLAGGEAVGSDWPTAVSHDSSGNVYIAGNTTGDIGELNAGLEDVFVAKFDSSGVNQWVSQLGDVTSGEKALYDDGAEGMIVDSSGNIYLAGYTDGNLGEPNAGGEDAILVIYNNDGTLRE